MGPPAARVIPTFPNGAMLAQASIHGRRSRRASRLARTWMLACASMTPWGESSPPPTREMRFDCAGDGGTDAVFAFARQ